MTNPLFWLVLSLLFVTVCLTVVLIVMIPTLKELGRAARSAEKLFETLRREFPPTLEAIRLTGMEITDLTDDITEGVQSAGQVAKQVDQTITGARKQVRKVQLGTRSLMTGVKTAWKTLTRSPSPPPRRPERLLPGKTESDLLSGSSRTRFIARAGEVVEEDLLAYHPDEYPTDDYPADAYQPDEDQPDEDQSDEYLLDEEQTAEVKRVEHPEIRGRESS